MGCCGVVGDGVGQMVSGGHVAIGGGLTPLLAQALQYFSAWPLAPLDGNTSMALAGVVVAGLGGGRSGEHTSGPPSQRGILSRLLPVKKNRSDRVRVSRLLHRTTRVA